MALDRQALRELFDLEPDSRGEVDIGTAQAAYALGRQMSRVHESPIIEVVRELTEEDLPLLLMAPPLPEEVRRPGQALAEVKHTHHQLARLVAQGKRPVEISAISGFSPGHIARMMQDPTFKQLVAHYLANEELIHVDVLARMRALHLDTIEELHKRLEAEPDGWSKRELMELADMMGKPQLETLKAKNQGQIGAPGGGAVNIGITFVQPQEAPKTQAPRTDDAIDVESQDVK